MKTTETSFLEATTRLALFGAKGIASGVGAVSGAVVASSDALGEHINNVPDSVSAGINNRTISDNYSSMKKIAYRGTRRVISNYREEVDDHTSVL